VIQDNHLAVLIKANEHPGSIDTKTLDYAGNNGGELGRDNPTFHASVGWDWVMTIRGRNTGFFFVIFLVWDDNIVE
jgi:hypothetical protein